MFLSTKAQPWNVERQLEQSEVQMPQQMLEEAARALQGICLIDVNIRCDRLWTAFSSVTVMELNEMNEIEFDFLDCSWR